MSTGDERTGARSKLGFRFSLLALFLFVTLICVALAWLVQPKRVEAASVFRVAKNPETVLDGGQPSFPDDSDYEYIRGTVLASVSRYFVLNAALRKPGIANLSVLQSQADPIEWLEDNLEVDFVDDSEYLEIKLVGPEQYSADYVRIVDAVSDAYMNEVVFVERSRRLGTRDLLNRSLESVQKKISEKFEVYAEIARQSGADDDAREAIRELTKSRLDRIDSELMRLEDEQSKLEGDGAGKAAYFEKRMTELRERQAELEAQLKAPAPASGELAVRMADIKVLQRIADDMSAKAVRMEIEANAAPRIEQVQKAVASPVD